MQLQDVGCGDGDDDGGGCDDGGGAFDAVYVPATAEVCDSAKVNVIY